MADQPGVPEDAGDEEDEQSGLQEVLSHPAHVAFLAGCVIVGAILSYMLIDGGLSAPRRIVGGALIGGFGWLLAMVHRII